MISRQTICDNLDKVVSRMRDMESRNGRLAGSVSLIAVSKRHPPEAISLLHDHGHLDFGENYVQEAVSKADALPDDIRWHFIGSLQSNKAKFIPGRMHMFHCLDSVKLARTLQNKCDTLDKTLDVLIQVNIGEEPQKSGVSPESLDMLVEQILDFDRIRLKGLMCLPPFFDDSDRARPFFSKLRLLRDGLETRFQMALPHLSMGMSGDYDAAIAEGATFIRVGTEIFGIRPM